jgi:hypothetical protein
MPETAPACNPSRVDAALSTPCGFCPRAPPFPPKTELTVGCALVGVDRAVTAREDTLRRRGGGEKNRERGRRGGEVRDKERALSRRLSTFFSDTPPPQNPTTATRSPARAGDSCPCVICMVWAGGGVGVGGQRGGRRGGETACARQGTRGEAKVDARPPLSCAPRPLSFTRPHPCTAPQDQVKPAAGR